MEISLLEALAARNLRGLVRAALSDHQKVHAYRHANGFDKVTLSPRGALVTVRAHFWHSWSEGEGAGQSAHNHRWDFCSRVLRGAMRVRVLVPESGGDRYQHYEYRPGTSDDVRFVGEASLLIVDDQTFEAGDFYFEDRELIHVAEAAPGSKAITVVAHGRVRSEAADVFTRQGSPALGERADQLSEDEFLPHLQSLADLVDRLGLGTNA